jgi:hypothetical protein
MRNPFPQGIPTVRYPNPNAACTGEIGHKDLEGVRGFLGIFLEQGVDYQRNTNLFFPSLRGNDETNFTTLDTLFWARPRPLHPKESVRRLRKIVAIVPTDNERCNLDTDHSKRRETGGLPFFGTGKTETSTTSEELFRKSPKKHGPE